MTRDDIIRMAREARIDNSLGAWWIGAADELERFAAAVAAAEREACAQVCDAAEKRRWEAMAHGGRLAGVNPADCAAAIRARGD